MQVRVSSDAGVLGQAAPSRLYVVERGVAAGAGLPAGRRPRELKTPVLTLHHLNTSRSQRVLWLLEELGAAVRGEAVPARPEDYLAPPELQRVHPLGKSPVVTDGARTLAEIGRHHGVSARRYGEGRLRPPAGTPERLRYTYWLHYAEGSAMPPLLLKLVFQRLPERAGAGAAAPAGRARHRPGVTAAATSIRSSQTHRSSWEDELSEVSLVRRR